VTKVEDNLVEAEEEASEEEAEVEEEVVSVETEEEEETEETPKRDLTRKWTHTGKKAVTTAEVSEQLIY